MRRGGSMRREISMRRGGSIRRGSSMRLHDNLGALSRLLRLPRYGCELAANTALTTLVSHCTFSPHSLPERVNTRSFDVW